MSRYTLTHVTVSYRRGNWRVNSNVKSIILFDIQRKKIFLFFNKKCTVAIYKLTIGTSPSILQNKK